MNKKIITLIEKRQKWYGFTQYFRNGFLQYHTSEFNENLYTKGGEYTLPNGSNYIGFYHIMDSGVAMTGGVHGRGGDIILTPIEIKPTSTSTFTGGGGY